MNREAHNFHRIHFYFILLFTILTSVFLCSNQSYALDLFPNANLVQGNFNSQFYLTQVNNSNCDNSVPTDTWLSSISCTLGRVFVERFSVSIPNRSYNAGDWIVIDINVIGGGAGSSSYDRSLGIMYAGTNPVDLISVDYSNLNASSALFRIYMRVYQQFTGSALDFSGIDNNAVFDVFSSGSNSGPGILRMNPTSVWHESVFSDNSSTISSINNSIGSVNNKLDTLNSGISDLKSSQQQSNSDANDRYQDEKDTINNATDEGKDTMEDLQQNTGFSLLNPFQWFFGLFSDECSIELPVAFRNYLSGGRSGSIDSTYTSWWCRTGNSRTLRDILTVTFSFLSIILTFKFLWKWLATNEGEN